MFPGIYLSQLPCRSAAPVAPSPPRHQMVAGDLVSSFSIARPVLLPSLPINPNDHDLGFLQKLFKVIHPFCPVGLISRYMPIDLRLPGTLKHAQSAVVWIIFKWFVKF